MCSCLGFGSEAPHLFLSWQWHPDVCHRPRQTQEQPPADPRVGGQLCQDQSPGQAEGSHGDVQPHWDAFITTMSSDSCPLVSTHCSCAAVCLHSTITSTGRSATAVQILYTTCSQQCGAVNTQPLDTHWLEAHTWRWAASLFRMDKDNNI